MIQQYELGRPKSSCYFWPVYSHVPPHQMICLAGYSGIQGARPKFWKRPLRNQEGLGLTCSFFELPRVFVSCYDHLLYISAPFLSRKSRLGQLGDSVLRLITWRPYRTPILFLFFCLLVFEQVRKRNAHVVNLARLGSFSPHFR